jgi:uncharacterized protein with GYD domain
MAHYLVQVAYTADAWASLVKNPQNRISVVSKTIENLGGKLLHGWMCFGDFDTVVIMDMPDNVSAAAFAAAIAAGGSCKGVKTTPLLSPDDGVEAASKAHDCGYQPISQSVG